FKMSSDSLQSLGRSISQHIEERDDDWVLIDEMEGLCLKVLPGQMIKIRDDQVVNNAGGFVFAVSDVTRIRRFLILGVDGGSYYSSEKEMTLDNVNALKDIIHRGKADLILNEIKEISLAGRNPKQDPIMIALALCARYRVSDLSKKAESKTGQLYQEYLKVMHKDAMRLVNEVCRIPTHLFSFVKFCEMVSADVKVKTKEEIKKEKEARKETGDNEEKMDIEIVNDEGGKKSTGWGRLMRKVIEGWYTSRTPEQLAMHLTKYGQRDGWSHKDLFRLCHPIAPKGDNQLVYEQIFHYAVKGNLNERKRRLPSDSDEAKAAKVKYIEEQMKNEEESKALVLIEKFLSLTKETPDEEVAKAIKEIGLVREHIPTEKLNSVEVWEALVQKMPMTAMIRNLAKMQTIGLLAGENVVKVANEVKDKEALKKARVHPIQLLLAKTVYDQGRGEKGKLTWEPEKEISAALEAAFYAAFTNVPPTEKRFCLAFDVSGSMGCQIAGTCISARQASAAIGLNLLKVEKDVECVGFCHELVKLPYKGDWTLEKVSNHMDSLRFGSTDCALPMEWARQEKKKFDVFIVFTDNETYFGEVHPFKALQDYRESSGINARLIVCGMTATNFTIADPTDAGMMDVIGFDSAVPELIANFIQGHI
ncbi:rop-1, partial [Pristionchus pacificus]